MLLKRLHTGLLLFACACTQVSVAQTDEPPPYVRLREADIMWLKRVWREVDMREKQNHIFYFPVRPDQGRKSFMTVLLDAVFDGSITAYSALTPDSLGYTDQFATPMTPLEVRDRFRIKQYVTVTDEITLEEKEIESYLEIGYEEVKKFWIKEEVFFDKQRSVMETRILGIAPIIPNYQASGEITGEVPAFWVYFPQARWVFAQHKVFNLHNGTHLLSYDDLFWKRMFASRIIKESNVHNRYIGDYKSPMDALLEAESIKQRIFHREHDLWEY